MEFPREKILGATAVLGCAAAMFSMFSASSDGGGRVAKVAGTDPTLAAIEAEIHEFRSNWKPQDQERWIESRRGTGDDLAPALARLFARPSHPMCEDGLRLAAELEIGVLSTEISVLAEGDHASLRPVAIRAGHAIDAWSVEQLELWLGEENPAVRIAALEACDGLDELPWREMLECLLSDDCSVQAAAVAAMPAELPEEAIEELLDIARSQDQGSAIGALTLLAENGVSEQVEELMTACLEDYDDEVVAAALGTLTATKVFAGLVDKVHEVAFDTTRSADVRCRALLCLEVSRSFDAELIESNISSNEPEAAYFAARCLIAGRVESGPRMLLELVRGVDETGDRADPGRALAADDSPGMSMDVASRQVLGWLTGLGPSAKREQYERAIDEAGTTWDARAMPAAPPF